MTVGLVGSGPAVDAIEAALADSDVEAVAADPDSLAGHDLAVAVGRVGDGSFERIGDRARELSLPWLAVELGGVGGVPVVDASVAGFTPETACYRCLSGRVSANVDPAAEPTAAPAPYVARFAGALAGREATKFCVPEVESTVFGALVEVPHARRTVLPLPNCACGKQVSHELDRHTVESDVEASLARAEQGLDDRVGIVQQVGEAESFPAPYYLARSCDTSGFSDATAARDAAGVAPGWDAAFMKALGEAYERYCAGVYRSEDYQTGPPDAVENPVAPAAFVTPDAPTGEEDLQWVHGENLHTGASVSLPATFVSYPPPNERFRPAITTGLGLGNGGTEALLSGLTEVIERDAAMLAWYSTFEPIALTVADEGFEQLRTRAQSEDLTVTALLLTQDVDVPVVAVAVQRDEWPRFAIGTAAALDATAAARSALAEALQNWMELRGMGPEDASEASGAIGQYAAEPGEAATFVDVDTVASADTVGPSDVPEGEDALEVLLDRLSDVGATAYAARTTTRDVAALDFEAVRVLVPTAQPLFFDTPYFGERAATVPGELGFEPRPGRPHHPFP